MIPIVVLKTAELISLFYYLFFQHRGPFNGHLFLFFVFVLFRENKRIALNITVVYRPGDFQMHSNRLYQIDGSCIMIPVKSAVLTRSKLFQC